MSERDYYKCRDGSLYTKHTKQEISDLIEENCGIPTIELLQGMDYPWVPNQWERCGCHFGKYIATMRLKGYRDFGWKDNSRFQSLEPSALRKEVHLKMTEFPDKIVLTKRDDGDWDCVIEQAAYDGEKNVPLKITGVIEKSAIPAMLTFKISDECLYKMEVINTDATDD